MRYNFTYPQSLIAKLVVCPLAGLIYENVLVDNHLTLILIVHTHSV